MFNSQSTDDNSFFWSSFGLRLWDNADGPVSLMKEHLLFNSLSRYFPHSSSAKCIQTEQTEGTASFYRSHLKMNEWIRSVNVWIFTSARLQTLRCSVKSCSLPRALSVSELLRPELTCQRSAFKTAALHKKAQTDTLIILKPCGTGCLDLKSSSPFYHKITVITHWPFVVVVVVFSPRRNPSDDLRYTFRRKSPRISRRGRPKGLCGFPVEMCPFSLYNWRFHASTIVGRECEEKGEFLFLEIPLAFCCDWTRTDG